MIIVKITFLLFLITAISFFFLKSWVESNPAKAIMLEYKEEKPAWYLLFGLLIIFDIAGIVLSAIWFLFFYL